ncbi:MAG: hypothetical protein U0L36_05675, partial [Acutalibacteraceae bacterium]|nr:hypothetical protein [Acutalibacteraceae bacterium]
RIQYIAEKEGLTVTSGAATLIASAADGGMRDALSILDLCASNSKNIDEAVVESVCAMAGNDYLIELSDGIKRQDTEGCLLLLDKLHNSSVDMLRLLSELTSHFRDLMIVKTVKTGKRPIVCSTARMTALENQAESYSIKEIMYCLSVLQSAFSAMQTGNRRTEMEMAIIKLCSPSLSADTESLERRVSILENTISNMANANPAIVSAPKPTAEEEDEEIPLPEDEYTAPAPKETETAKETVAPTTATDSGITPVEQWNEIIRILKTDCPLIGGVLNDSRAFIKGQYLLIDAPNSQFRSLINSGNSYYKDSIRKAAFKVLGQTYKLGPYTTPKSNTTEDDPLKAIAERLKNFEMN